MGLVFIKVTIRLCGLEAGTSAQITMNIPLEDDSQAPFIFGDQREVEASGATLDSDGVQVYFPPNNFQSTAFALAFNVDRWTLEGVRNFGGDEKIFEESNTRKRRRGERGDTSDSVRDAICAFALVARVRYKLSQRKAVRAALDYAAEKHDLFLDEETLLGQLKSRYGNF
jgi:hypothetical protein